MNPSSRGQERYRQANKSMTGKSAVTESITSNFRISQFPSSGNVPEPKRVTVSKPAHSDTKLEGFSLSKARMQETGLPQGSMKPIEDDYINNLQQQIYLTEMEIKLIKDQEVARANKFMGGLDAGPLTENLVMLKGKYKKIQEDLQGKIDELSHENRELQAKNSTANINYTRFLEDIKDFENKLAQERDFFDKESEKYRKAISTTSFFKEENSKILSDSSKARDMAKAYTGETRIKIERQGSLILSLEEKLSQAETFKTKIIEEKNKQILSLQEKLFRLREDVKNSSTLGIVQEKLTFLNANKQEVEMERDNLLNRIKTLKQSKAMIEKAAAQLQLDKRSLINQVEECKLEMEREKSQQELILNQKMRQKEDKELKNNTTLLEDTRMENEYIMSLLKELISNNTEIAEERTQLHYDIEELKEKREMADKEFQALKGQCILLEGDLKDMSTKIRTIEERIKETGIDMESKVSAINMMSGENQEMREKLEYLKKKVEINEQLKNIDLEELKLIAKSNLVMNNNITDLISKWENLNEKKSNR